MRHFVIVGAGGFGREVYQWLNDWITHRARDGSETYRIKGFLSDDAAIIEGEGEGSAGLLGTPRDYEVQDDDRLVMAIGNPRDKRRVAEDLMSRKGKFFTLIHPSACVASTATLGEGVVICPFATVSVNVLVADFVMLNLYASIGHDARIGKYGVLSPYATLNGFAMLEEEVFLGTHASVTRGVRVGDRAVIGANSTAMRDVPAHSLVMGVPGKIWPNWTNR